MDVAALARSFESAKVELSEGSGSINECGVHPAKRGCSRLGKG